MATITNSKAADLSPDPFIDSCPTVSDDNNAEGQYNPVSNPGGPDSDDNDSNNLLPSHSPSGNHRSNEDSHEHPGSEIKTVSSDAPSITNNKRKFDSLELPVEIDDGKEEGNHDLASNTAVKKNDQDRTADFGEIQQTDMKEISKESETGSYETVVNTETPRKANPPVCHHGCMIAMPNRPLSIHNTTGSDETMEFIPFSTIGNAGAGSSYSAAAGKLSNIALSPSAKARATVETSSTSMSPRRDRLIRGSTPDDMLAQYTSQTLSRLEAVLETCVKKITLLGSELDKVKAGNENLNNKCEELSQQLRDLMLQDNCTDITEISFPQGQFKTQTSERGAATGEQGWMKRFERVMSEDFWKKQETVLDINNRTLALLEAQRGLLEVIGMVDIEIKRLEELETENSRAGWCVLM
ncbi:hypothetical protein F5884DRAFT_892740 [Xylogone sp. PMI_703]|nr:hypothetical protein F5884DRAFT_892740 [Xylogone sp. PMI_703]